jgi:hypothetical protein
VRDEGKLAMITIQLQLSVSLRPSLDSPQATTMLPEFVPISTLIAVDRWLLN